MAQSLSPGDRVRIRAIREVGSAKLLSGLAGEIIGPHLLANGWYKIRLDQNEITAHEEWSAPGDCLVRYDEISEAQAPKSQMGVKHFP